ncbi:MAG: FAD-dependent oxidoreductase [Alphaproteobacteria bacterium]|nr:FAD-dependent oxidoreductase [Alphaproteobacteria bacterium]
MKYVIIGNGIIALSTAFRLSGTLAPDDTVTIIGPGERVGSATLAAAAMLNSFAEIEAGSLRSDAALYHFELSHRATRMWPEFERELIEAAGDHLPKDCAQCQILTGGCFAKGTYVLNNTASDDLDDRNFDAIVQALRDFNEPFDDVDPGSIPNYVPAPRYRATRAILIHDEGWLNPHLVIEKLEAILSHRPGVVFRNAKAERLVGNGAAVEGVALDDGETVPGDVFLLANGASVGEILKKSGLGLAIQPVFYGVGVSLEIAAPGHPHEKCIRTPNRGGACGIYTVPYFTGPDRANDHILIGASNFLSPDPFFHGRVVSVAHLLESAMNEINAHFYDAQLVRVNVGWRPTSQDTYPLLGRTSLANLVVATGTKRDGFHLSPVLSETITAILRGEPVDERWAMYTPERAPIRDLTREEAVRTGVASLMSQHYQHGYRPSGIRMDADIRDSFRRDLETLHDQVGAVDWGIPPELLNMYRRGHAR